MFNRFLKHEEEEKPKPVKKPASSASKNGDKVGWQNRIVDHGTRPASEFVANPKNWRTHPVSQRAAVEGSLNELGWIDTVIVNRRTGYLVDGHERLWQALKAGEDTPVPFIEVDLSEEEEALALASLDPITGMAGADRAKLDELMQEIQTGEAGLQEMLSELAEDNGLYFGEQEERPEDAGAKLDKADELREKWGVESGQMWRLGEHRIICGDCTEEAVIDIVMGGELAKMVWTDPPYGVSYGAKLEAANPMGYRVREIKNDDLNPDKLEAFIRSAFKVCARNSIPGAALYSACPAGTLLPSLIAAFAGSGFDFRWGLVWVKDRIVLSRSDYHFQHENILYGWKPDGAHHWHGDRKQSSCMFVDRPSSSEEHPTMKPVELIEIMVSNNSENGDIVLEPFAGSGSTIMACERLGRKCRAVEIEPKYVAVSIQRWVDMTGGEPELID